MRECNEIRCENNIILIFVWLASVANIGLHLDIPNTPCSQTICAPFHRQY